MALKMELFADLPSVTVATVAMGCRHKEVPIAEHQ